MVSRCTKPQGEGTTPTISCLVGVVYGARVTACMALLHAIQEEEVTAKWNAVKMMWGNGMGNALPHCLQCESMTSSSSPSRGLGSYTMGASPIPTTQKLMMMLFHLG